MLCPTKTRFVAVCFLATLFASLGAARADTIPEIVAKTKQAVVEILTYDQQNRLLKTGTGFFISPGGALLTNYHVISGGSSIVAETPTGAAYFLKNIVTESEADDIAELQFLANDVPYLTLGSSSSAVEGERVFSNR
jgi:S1-C subfamily serine protease